VRNGTARSRPEGYAEPGELLHKVLSAEESTRA
jgi:hypothetical protein